MEGVEEREESELRRKKGYGGAGHGAEHKEEKKDMQEKRGESTEG